MSRIILTKVIDVSYRVELAANNRRMLVAKNQTKDTADAIIKDLMSIGNDPAIENYVEGTDREKELNDENSA